MRTLAAAGLGLWGCSPAGVWVPMSDVGAPQARGGAISVWTGDEMLVWGGWSPEEQPVCTFGVNSLRDGARYDPADDTWRVMAPYLGDQAPELAEHVWIGDRWLVVFPATRFDFPRRAPDMAVYDPATDTWATLEPPHALLDPDFDYHPVWTGSEVFLFAGGSNGAALDPATGVWRPVAPFGHPEATTRSVAAWTGDEVLVWSPRYELALGGVVEPWGGRWDPATNTWRPLAAEQEQPSLEPSVYGGWTGTHLAVLGVDVLGARVWRYDPVADAWAADPEVGPRFDGGVTATFTGDAFLLLGEPPAWDFPLFGVSGGVARYDLGERAWLPVEDRRAPLPRLGHAAVWTGAEWIAWGGGDWECGEVSHGDGARWRP